MSSTFQQAVWDAQRAALERLQATDWEGDLEEAVADSPEVEAVHRAYARQRRPLTAVEARRTQERAAGIQEDLLSGVIE